MHPFRAEAELARDLTEETLGLVKRLQGRVAVRDKGGNLGPVTDADLAAEGVLLAGLARHHPADPVLSEESRPRTPLPSPRLWCVDPIDGTQEYADGLDEFAVQVGLLVDGEPVAGACALGTGEVLWGWAGGGCRVRRGGEEREVRAEPAHDLEQAVAVHSRKHLSRRTADALARMGVSRLVPAGGVGFKAMQILLGRAHLYLHMGGGTTWWDTVGPAAVFAAAGGIVRDASGAPLRYGDDVRHRTGLLFASPGLAERAAAHLG